MRHKTVSGKLRQFGYLGVLGLATAGSLSASSCTATTVAPAPIKPGWPEVHAAVIEQGHSCGEITERILLRANNGWWDYKVTCDGGAYAYRIVIAPKGRIAVLPWEEPYTLPIPSAAT